MRLANRSICISQLNGIKIAKSDGIKTANRRCTLAIFVRKIAVRFIAGVCLCIAFNSCFSKGIRYKEEFSKLDKYLSYKID